MKDYLAHMITLLRPLAIFVCIGTGILLALYIFESSETYGIPIPVAVFILFIVMTLITHTVIYLLDRYLP